MMTLINRVRILEMNKMSAIPLQRNERIQNHRKSALMHTVVLSVLLDAGGTRKIRAVITSVRSIG